MLTVWFCSFAGTGPGPDSLKRGEWGSHRLGREMWSDWACSEPTGGLEHCLVWISVAGMAGTRCPPGWGVGTRSETSCLGKGSKEPWHGW